MDPSRKFHIQPLFNRLEQIHNQVMRDVETAKRKHVLVFRPLAFDQFNIQSLLLEESVLDRTEDRGFAGNTDVSDPYFRSASSLGFRCHLSLIASRGENHGA